MAEPGIDKEQLRRLLYLEMMREFSPQRALAKSHAELITALRNYADDDECVCSLDPRAPDSSCCACIAQGVLDRARKL